MSLQQPLFGPELRRRRLNAGLTLGQLAQRVHYSKGQLSKVERGLKPPSREVARLCDAALDAEGALMALAPPQREPGGLVSCEKADDVWVRGLAGEEASASSRVDRRRVVTAGAATVIGLGVGRSPAEAATAPTGGGGTLLEVSRSLFDDYRRLGRSVPAEVVLPTVLAQTQTLRDLSETARGRTRNGLLALASRYAEYVGWLVQETGDDRAALWWTDRAVELADAAGDHDLADYAHVRRALVTLYRDDARQTVALARRAQHTRAPFRIRGLAAQREAQGHALAGDYNACMRCLDRARDLLARAVPENDAPPLGTTSLSDPVAMIGGWCLYDLGRPERSAEVMDRELLTLPRHSARSRARFGARRALAHAVAGDVGRACLLTERLLEDVDAVSSATIRSDLRRLARTLARHPRHPEVRRLAPRLSASVPTSFQ